MNDEERQKLVKQVADEIILSGELRNFFSNMSDTDIDDLAGRLSGRINSTITLPAIRKTKRAAPMRIRVNDGDVNEDENGVEVGHTGPTLPDIINFHGATGWLETSDGRELHLTMSGGADCMFDWLVSECYADLVAAGTHIEGQLFTSLTGCTFYVTSTVQQAWDGVGTGVDAGLKEASDAGGLVCYICPGDAGPLAITGDSAGGGNEVRFIGSGYASRIEASGTGSGAAGMALSVAGGSQRPLTFQNLSIGNESSTRAFSLTDGSNVTFVDCLIGHSGGHPPVASDTSGQTVTAYRTIFLVAGASQYALDMNGNGNDSRFFECQFNDRVRVGTETKFIDCRFNRGPSGVGIDATNGASVWASGCEFRTSGSAFTSYISCDGTANAGHIFVSGCWSYTGATQAILIASDYLGNGTSTHHIVNNRWACALGLNSTDPTPIERLNYSGNTHSSTDPGFAAFAYAQGEFDNCTFDANGPSIAYVTFTTPTGINRVNGVQVGGGAPSHTASEGQEYWDMTANTMYVNTDGGTTWAILGVSGGGAAAPVGEPYVTIGNTAGLSAERALTSANGVDVIDGGANSTVTLRVNTLMDDDGDTLVQTEETADEDIIRFDAGGTQNVVQMAATGTTFNQVARMVADLRLVLAADLTIATGAITTTAARHHVDTEAAAASDDLDTINGGSAGDILILSPVDGARTIVIKHNTGNILCVGDADITLDDAHDFALLVYEGELSKWMAAGFTGGGAGSPHALLDGGTAHSDTATDSVSRGSMIIGNSTPAWDELVIGVAGTFPLSDGTDITHQSLFGRIHAIHINSFIT